MRRAAEADRDLAHALRQPLAGAQIERHAGPAPVVDLEPHGDVGLRRRVGLDALFLPVARDGLALDVAGAVLRAQRDLVHFRRIDRMHRVHDLVLLVAHRAGVEGHRWLHGDQAEQLQHVVLNHVTQRAGLLVIRAAALDADRLRHRDLHLGHVIAVPDGLEDAVGEPEHEDVLDGLFAEVVIDPVDLLFLEDAHELPVQCPRAFQIAAERFLHDDARPAAVDAGEAGGAEARDDIVVETGRCRAVEEPVARAAPRGLDLLEALLQPGVQLRRVRVAGDIEEAARKAIPHVLRGDLESREARDALAHASAEGLVRHLAASRPDDGERLGQRPRRVEAPQRRHQLAVRQVSGGAEDDKRERLIGVRHGPRTDCGAPRAAGPRRSCHAASGSARTATP